MPATVGGKFAKIVQREEFKFSELYKLPWVKVIERGGDQTKEHNHK